MTARLARLAKMAHPFYEDLKHINFAKMRALAKDDRVHSKIGRAHV